MKWYARPGLRMAGQLGGDLALLCWIVLCALAGRALGRAVEALAAPAERTGVLAGDLSQQMGQAEGQVARVPGVGGDLSQPFGNLSRGLQDIVTQAHQQAQSIHHLATVAGWLCFAIPTVAAIAWWVPRRVRFVRQATAAQRFIDGDEDLDLFALRAMASLPMTDLARVSADPVGDWRAGNRDVVRRLAELELRRNGLSLPRGR